MAYLVSECVSLPTTNFQETRQTMNRTVPFKFAAAPVMFLATMIASGCATSDTKIDRRLTPAPKNVVVPELKGCKRITCTDYIVDHCGSNPENPRVIIADAPIYVYQRGSGKVVAQCGGICDGRARTSTICPPLCEVDFKGCHSGKDGQAVYGWGK